jgi:outer membrane biogenesis lipoprotein LolB
MKANNILFYVISVFLLASCEGNLSEESVVQKNQEAFELTEKFILQQNEKYEKTVKDRLEKVNDKLGKLEDVSEDSQTQLQDDLSSPIVRLQQEKEMLEIELKDVKYRTDTSIHALRRDFTGYNGKLTHTLNDIKERFGKVNNVEKEK